MAWGSGFPVPAVPVGDVRTVSVGDVIEAGGLAIEVMHTPGHTPGSICFRLPDRLFSGDLVFRGSIGRFDFPNASEEAMVRSLRRFLELPDELAVYPGHNEPTTVGAER